MKLAFPPHFFWGTSTAAAQVETAFDHQWKGVKAADGYVLDRTTDHEQRRGEDLAYIRRFGSVYRCGVDWSRLQRAPFEPFDPETAAEYRDFFEQLNLAGMKILFVLHHFAHPRWFEAAGGWQKEDNVPAYIDYVTRCLDHFGPFVFNWNTFNEPNVYAMNAFLLGNFPPFRKSYRKAIRALRFMGMAHDIAYDLIKRRYPDHPVSISLNTACFEGLNWPGRIPARFTDWWFHKKAARPFEKVDYWGLSYYAYVPFDPRPVTEIERPGRLDRLGIPHDQMWGYRPEGLGRILRRFHRRYGLPILIAENGICTDDPQRRIQSIKDYLAVCHRSIHEDGVDLRGYIHWSPWDNFEWHLGPTYRFGLVRVNLETKERTATPAADFYASVCSENAVHI